ncbi:hypothetical protein M5689_003257 [Euphorbia peplus]|nr:hypothetical protein M5689_003257 [Euphorbia peplus]
MGDFNEIATACDQKGGSQHYLNCCIRHRKSIDNCGVFDSGCFGYRFTWRRNNLFVRLDKVYMNMSARLNFPNASVTNLSFRSSNHCPMLFRLFGKEIVHFERSFRYLLAWETHHDFKKFVADTWLPNNDPISANQNFCNSVCVWIKEMFGHITAKKVSLMNQLTCIQYQIQRRADDQLVTIEKKLQQDLLDVLAQEELLWFQKSRKQWISQGERNSRYFHLSTIIHRNQNKIEAITDEQGNWCQDEKSIRQCAVHFFSNLFASEGGQLDKIKTLNRFKPIQRESYNRAFGNVTENDIRTAIFGMGATKAPGIDGLPTIFFQNIGIL